VLFPSPPLSLSLSLTRDAMISHDVVRFSCYLPFAVLINILSRARARVFHLSCTIKRIINTYTGARRPRATSASGALLRGARAGTSRTPLRRCDFTSARSRFNGRRRRRRWLPLAARNDARVNDRPPARSVGALKGSPPVAPPPSRAFSHCRGRRKGKRKGLPPRLQQAEGWTDTQRDERSFAYSLVWIRMYGYIMPLCIDGLVLTV